MEKIILHFFNFQKCLNAERNLNRTFEFKQFEFLKAVIVFNIAKCWWKLKADLLLFETYIAII